MNAVTWAVNVFAPTALACVPLIWFAVRGFRANARERARERALDRAVDEALPRMWQQVNATLKRRQP